MSKERHTSARSDAAVARMAAAQQGVVTRRQLIAAGLGRRAIDHRGVGGRLHRMHRGVYVVGHTAVAPLARQTAAVLAVGRDAVVSHQTAAALWGFWSESADAIHVTVPGRRPWSRPGVRVHRVRELDRRDVRHRHGIPITAPARTLLDLAGVPAVRDLERVVAEAHALRLTTRDELAAAVHRYPKHRGAARLRRFLAAGAEPALTRSEAERRLLSLLRRADLEPDAVNVRVGRHEVDFLWRRQRLVVEVDGFTYHGRAAFERDRLRDAELQAAGYRVIRVTWRQLVERPEAVLARIAAALARAA